MDEKNFQGLSNELDSLLGSEESPEKTSEPDVSSLREELALLAASGKAEEAIGMQLTQQKVRGLTDKQVEKLHKRYETFVSSKSTQSLNDSFIFCATKAVGFVLPIKDMEAYQKELKNDYIVQKELSSLSGKLALLFGRVVALLNAVFMTLKHVDYQALINVLPDQPLINRMMNAEKLSQNLQEDLDKQNIE